MRIEIRRMEETMQKLLENKDDQVLRNTGVADFNLEEFKIRIQKEDLDKVEKAKVIALQFLKDSDPVLPAAAIDGT